MASQKKSAFLTEHYDKLVLVAALAVLVAALAALLVGAGSSKAESAKFARRIQALSNLERRNVQVVPGLLFAAAREAARTSYAMSGTNVAFLVAPERVSCVKCAQPIPIDADVCHWCSAEQPSETVTVDETWDSDSDGMPDEWEKKYSLDPFSDDSGLDPDTDGFTNLEEFQGGTDPKDAKSHPARFAFLRVSSIDVEPFPFGFNGSKMKGADGEYKFAVKDASGRDWYVRKGQELAKTGFVLKEYSSAIEERKTSTGLRKMEIFTLRFVKGDDQVVMKAGSKPESSIYKASFVCAKDAEPQTYVAKRNETFDFDGDTFRLVSVDRKAGTAKLERASNKEQVDVPAR